MKPELKTYTLKLEKQYWTCNIPDHRHKTKEVANICIKNRKFGGKRGGGKTPRKWTPLELDEMIEDRRNGMTWSAIGAKWGISTSRAFSIVERDHYYLRITSPNGD